MRSLGSYKREISEGISGAANDLDHIDWCSGRGDCFCKPGWGPEGKRDTKPCTIRKCMLYDHFRNLELKMLIYIV